MTDHSDWEFFQDEGYFGMWCVRENGVRRFGEGFHTVSEEEAEALASALSSQSLSLSEARERGDEYERLYRQTHLDYVAAEYRLDAVSAAIGSPRFMDPPDGGDVSLAEQVRRMRAELEAKEARLAALENGPAGRGHPDDCTFVSPSNLSKEENDA